MIINQPKYLDDLQQAIRYVEIPNEASVLITGATGLIGSFLMDAFFYSNQTNEKQIKITGTSRHLDKLKARFSYAADFSWMRLVARDATDPIPEHENYDYIIHLASNADPRSYALYPAETIITNILGTLNILNYAKTHVNTRVLLASTFEVYGSIPEAENFLEENYGRIDFNQIRSGYPESKRTAELLIRSFVEEYNVNAVIARLSSIYGPTMANSDNKAAAQFIRKAIAKKNIVLKSKGEQCRSYCYVADAASGILAALCRGSSGEAYNVCNPACEITIAELAQIAASIAGTRVIYDLPDELELKGFSKQQNSFLNADKLISLGFKPRYSAEKGMRQAIEILCMDH